MRVVTTIGDLERASAQDGVFIPTMGALHEGHAALVREGARLKRDDRISGPVVVSVFVNPTQFNDKSDLARYPRTLDADVAMCDAAGAELVFAPGDGVVYPPGVMIPTPPLPAVATQPGLEDALRPGHFAGVCQVVARLFELVRPAVAVFGEKDWQQLQVIRAMVEDARRPRIVGLATVRESDGLAMSSRNVFLSPDERLRATAISRALSRAGAEATAAAAERTMREIVTSAGLHVQYAVVRHAHTLLAPGEHGPYRALIAAKLGSVRLIDNAAWPAN